MHPNEGNLTEKGLGKGVEWSELAKDLRTILDGAEKGGSAFFKNNLYPKIIERAGKGDVAGIRSLLITSYFTAAEIEKINGELKAYQEENVTTEKKSESKEIPAVTVENKKKKKQKDKNPFGSPAELKETTDNLQTAKFEEGSTNKVEEVAELKAEEHNLPEPEPVVIEESNEPVASNISEATNTQQEVRPTGEPRSQRVPEPETAERLDSIIEKNKDAINALLERKDLPIVTHENPDLDSKAAIYLLTMLGGLKDKEIQYIGKGKSAEKGILIDVGNTNDLLSIDKDRVVFDHHFPDQWVETSSTEIMLETLKKLGRIEKIDGWMRDFANFVTEVDNMSYDSHDTDPKWFKESYPKTMLGLREALPIEMIAELFKSGRGPYDVFSDEELKTIKVKNWKGKEESLKQVSDREAFKAKEDIKNAEKHERDNASRGLKLHTENFGKILYNDRTPDKETNKEKHKISMGAHAAYMLGYDGYSTWDPARSGYFGTAPGRNIIPFWNRLKAKDPNARPVRASMVINYPDTETKVGGTKLRQFEYERLLGITIPEKNNVATSVEYQVERIKRKEDQRKNQSYTSKLAETEFYFGKAQIQARMNRAVLEDQLVLTKGATDKKILEQRAMLEAKIGALLEEEKIWREKIALLQSLPKDQPEKYETLLDKSKLEARNKTIDTSTTASTEVETPKPSELYLNDAETYNAELAKLTKKDLELTLLDLGWPADEIEKRSIEELAEIVDMAETYKAPVKESAPVVAIENKEDTLALEREKKLDGLFAEINVINAQIATFDGTEEEHIDLMTRHYNTWALGRFFEEGGEIGKEPKPLTYNEILALRVSNGKPAETIAPAATEMEIVSVTGPEKPVLTPRSKLEAGVQIKILEEQSNLYKSKDLYERKFRKFNLEGEDYAAEAITTFEKDLTGEITALEKSAYAPYHADMIEQSKNLLTEGKAWYKNKFKKEFGTEVEKTEQPVKTETKVTSPQITENQAEVIERLKSLLVLTNEEYQQLRGVSGSAEETQKLLKEIIASKGKKAGDEISFELHGRERTGILLDDPTGFSIQDKADLTYMVTAQTVLVMDGSISLKAEKLTPDNLFVTEPEKGIELPAYPIKEIRREMFEIFDSMGIKSSKLKNFTLGSNGGNTLTLSFDAKDGIFSGKSDFSFSGKFENLGDSITLAEGSIFTNDSDFKKKIESELRKMGADLKEHLGKKLKKEVEKIQIENGALKITFK